MGLNGILLIIMTATVSCMAISASISFACIARAEVLRAKADVESKRRGNKRAEEDEKIGP